ncbi:helix-turn-helix transcriptional regulator [Streptococcus anginosus]|uniref:helix-turn-helix domain-containing protein n=1 Tax=Streptococcus anginosus TaxID=1328 RepID=UPI001244E59E|nr:helix-turn-helix transcriptional regulator [Streptococcus anginosus]KAA9308151.1 helix-turn-helix transcriptional regulator [Streptococcus anginosus]
MALNNTVLKELRKEKKLTQTELASKLDISQKSYSNWESGKAEPTLENIVKLSKILDTTADELLGIDKSVSSNWIHGIKTTITKILDIPKDSQLQKRIEEELNFEWNKYIKKYPDLPIYSKIDWIPYQELELKNYNEIIENKDKRDILKKSILCAYLSNENIFDIHYYLIKKWRLNELEIKHLNNIFLEVEEYHYLR